MKRPRAAVPAVARAVAAAARQRRWAEAGGGGLGEIEARWQKNA